MVEYKNVEVGDVIETDDNLEGVVMNVDDIENVFVFYMEGKGCRFLNLNPRSKAFDKKCNLIKRSEYYYGIKT